MYIVRNDVSSLFFFFFLQIIQPERTERTPNAIYYSIHAERFRVISMK